MRYILLILLGLFLTSCGSYRIQTNEDKVTHVLAVTVKGDTIQVPLRDLNKYNHINHWQFYYRDNWYGYYDWYYRIPFYNRWVIPNYSTPYFKPQPRYTPRLNQPERPKVKVRGRRGSDNNIRRYYTRPNNNTTPRSNNTRSNNVRPQIKPRVPNNNVRLKRGNSNREN